jgi:hypothetical protein
MIRVSFVGASMAVTGPGGLPGMISWVRVALMVGGILALFPLTFLFGMFGFLGGLFFSPARRVGEIACRRLR